MFSSRVPFSAGKGDIQFVCVGASGSGERFSGTFDHGEKSLLSIVEGFSRFAFLFRRNFAHEGAESGEGAVSSDGFRADRFHIGFGFGGSQSLSGFFDDALNFFQQFHILYPVSVNVF